MSADFGRLNECVTELQSTNSSVAKKKILSKYQDCADFFLYAENPYWMYGVTSKGVQKRLKTNGTPSGLLRQFEDVFQLLTALRKRELTGYEAADCVIHFMQTKMEHVHWDYLYQILDKKLKTRMGTSLINKVFPNLIPTFDVALAQDYEAHKKKVNFEQDEWFVSQKLDGVRVICIIDENKNCKFYSRNGKEFTTLGLVGEAIKNHHANIQNFVLDGELCVVDENGVEDFNGIVGEIKRKDHTIPNPCFKVFDMISRDDFELGMARIPLSQRITDMKMFMIYDIPYIDMVPQLRVNNNTHFEEWKTLAASKGWEGLMIRKNVPYKGKRSSDLLKVKQFKDDEYTIVDVETGPFRMIDPETGLEKTIDTMTAVVIEHKGNLVNVGSGWSLAERLEYYDNPEKLIGATITVKYFEISKNKEGVESLRFPTKKAVFFGERDV